MVQNMTLTRERLLEVLDYNPSTGVFTWKVRPTTRASNCRWNGKFAGKVADAHHFSGYIRISIDKKRYQAHVLAWLVVYGEWPDRFIDHKNLDKKDNRISNLRLADFAENSANAGIRSDNTSGHRGVYFRKQRQCWVAYLQKNGLRQQVGSFKEKHLAATAHAQAAERVFGDFCPEYLRGG